jgi:signal transduction histidine kinase
MTQQATILYIEDDEASRSLTQRVLTHAGYRVLLAARALEGLDLAKKMTPDLILIDINLPDMSGREIVVRLRSDPRLSGVPIVALTAQVHSLERDKTFAVGVNGYLTKPVDVPLLIAKVGEYLQGQCDEVDAARMPEAQKAYQEELVERLEASVRELEATNRDLRRLDRIKDDFIQLTSHELRTPLTTVYGYSRLVQTSPAILALMGQDSEVRACLQGLVDSVERLHVVMSEIITVSRIASGRIDLKLGPCHLGDVLRHVLADYGQVIQQRRLAITFDHGEWPSQFYADAALLELAFGNVLSNAIKYTPDGGSITLHARNEDGQVVISIKDTGIGISRDDQQYVFERFYTAGDTQLHSTSKTAYRGGGLGLGLAICRGIIEAHGGRIWVESPGFDEQRCLGSTFWIELPLAVNQTGQMRRTFL